MYFNGKDCEGVNGFFWLRIGFSGGPCECGSELSGSIKGGNFLISGQTISF
jgi:hypothetical protein